MLGDEAIRDFLTLKHELPSVEFKGPGFARDNPLFGRVVRAATGMANRRDGGLIILGVSQKGTSFTQEGLTEQQLASWTYESIADGFNRYAEPPITFDRVECQQDGKTFLALQIHEFADVPIICKQEYRDKSNLKIPDDQCKVILRPGAFYVRTYNKPETKEVLSIEDMRPLFELVADKGIRRFVTQTQFAGLQISQEARRDNDALFEEQLRDWTSPLLEEIHSRGHWYVVIRPQTFEKEHIPLSELSPLIRRTAFNIRGWEFPNTEGQRPFTGADWVGFENQWDRILEAWRLYQSGQFVHISGILDDWLDRSKQHPAPEGWAAGERLSVVGVVYRLTEIFEFAARLAVADAYRLNDPLFVEVALRNTQNRVLYDPGSFGRWPLLDDFPTLAPNITYSKEFAKEDIIAQAAELALQAARYIFERFGWNPSVQLLQAIQSDIRPNPLKTDE